MAADATLTKAEPDRGLLSLGRTRPLLVFDGSGESGARSTARAPVNGTPPSVTGF